MAQEKSQQKYFVASNDLTLHLHRKAKKRMAENMIHLYTGNGKGKTTAAIGLAFRAAGSGKKSIIIQFLKKGSFSEIESAKMFPPVQFEQYGSDDFYFPGKSNYIEHRAFSKQALDRIEKIMAEASCEVLVLDEVVHALNFGLVTMEELESIIRRIPPQIELVLTGRDAPDNLVDMCDLVTEMKDIKHYYSSGGEARKGIEY